MRTNSTTSFGSSSADEVLGPMSPSSATVDMNALQQQGRKRIAVYAKTFTMRFIQCVVQSRMNEKFDLPCMLPQSRDWFNVRYSEMGEITAQVKKSISSYPPDAPCVSVDFFLYTHEGEILPLETWTFSIESDEATESMAFHKEDDSTLYHQLGTLLKSCICAARMTPMHRNYVKKQSAETFIILYKVNSSESQIDLGQDSKEMVIGSLPSVIGNIRLRLAYRTKMQIDRTITPPGNQYDSFQQVSIASAGTTPDSRHNVGTPMSFCDDGISHFSVSPSSLPITSPVSSPPDFGSPYRSPVFKTSRSRSASATSDGDSICSADAVSASPRQNKFFHSQMIPSNMPFANLLTMSYTGTLYPLKEEKKEFSQSDDSPCDNDVNNCNMNNSGNYTDELKETLKDLSLHDDLPFGPLETRNDLCEPGESKKTLFNLNEVVGEREENSSPVEMSQRTIVGGEMENTVKDEESTQNNEENVINISDDEDSFVKIPSFGPIAGDATAENGGVDTQLGELLASCKAMPEILSFSEPISADVLIPNIMTHFEEFSRHQCVFDQFVAEVRETHRKEFARGVVQMRWTWLSRNVSQFAGVRDAAKYVPRRSLLYVPASNEKMLAKVPRIQADCVVLELEDSVAMTAKTKARQQAAKALDTYSNERLECFELGLRVNSVSSGLLEDDVKEICKAEHLPQAFMVPKVDSPEDLATIFDIFRTNYGATRITDTNTRLVIWIESARALLDMPRILSSALNLHRNSGFFKLDAVVFGSDDYCADIGATRSSHGTENLFARQKFVACCKAFQLQAIDSVYIDIKDTDGLRRQSDEGRSWGFTGKQTIHPSQVAVVQETFMPPGEKVEWATELVHAYSQHESEGKGAFQFRGQMIDRPLLLQALNLIQLVERVSSR
ncbi:unnamed protein product [Caenorhabditis auriculariae]|uniref:Citramalyl-CoA lyase, mitochondrial n=1 Tax=Caenorhabditis auriculariae TaxID=2777116 RepID=A0A8S1HL37_9PELO|nr:unnamed protein product [Caenorhabditis auriculariae]